MYIIHQGRWRGGLWLEWSSSGREVRVQLHRGEPVLEIPASSPPVFLLQPLASCQDLTSLIDTYTSHSPLSEVPHPGRNISDSFTGYDILIREEACPRVGFLSIEGQHVASHVQVHASRSHPQGWSTHPGLSQFPPTSLGYTS